MSFKPFSIPLLLLLSQNALSEDAINPINMTVYRSASCSCCAKWIEHVKQNRFNITTVVSDDLQAIKAQYGIPDKLASCHTAKVNGYIVEGHVPAEDIQKLLQTKPDIIGVAAPGMPMGSPGMELDGLKQPYRVISFDKQSKLAVFSEHDGH
jgi:hypothetical protein